MRSRLLAAMSMALAVLVPGPLHAQGSASSSVAPSSGSWAMPGLHRVLVASEAEPGVDAALVGGWAYTEDVLRASDSHHRFQGSAALAGRPLSWLTLAGRIDGRYDVHLSPTGDDDAAVGEPRVAIRGDFDVGSGLALGLAAIVFMPGGDAPSLVPEATTLDLRALASYRPEGVPLVLAIDVGYRLDNTARAASQPETFRRSDLLTLSANASDAVLLGLGGMVRVDATDLFFEATSELFVEDPQLLGSFRFAAGVRAPLVPNLLAFQGTLEAFVADRGDRTSRQLLSPTEPRVALTVGLILSPRSSPEAPAEVVEPVVVDPVVDPLPPTEVLPPASRTLRGTLRGPDGEPLPGARVRVVASAELTPIAEGESAADGAFVIEGVPADLEVTLEIEAVGYATRQVRVAAGADATLAEVVSLERALPRGALRGLVRTTRGVVVTARVHVEGSGEAATTDADGAFELELLPGRYTIVIESEGRASQRRTIEIEEGGVTVLNVELRGAR